MDKSLKTADIKGNQPGTKGLGNFHSRERREARSPMKNDDIAGASPGSLARGITGPRKCNPLDPNYQMPGETEQKIGLVSDPFGRQGCSMTI